MAHVHPYSHIKNNDNNTQKKLIYVCEGRKACRLKYTPAQATTVLGSVTMRMAICHCMWLWFLENTSGNPPLLTQALLSETLFSPATQAGPLHSSVFSLALWVRCLAKNLMPTSRRWAWQLWWWRLSSLTGSWQESDTTLATACHRFLYTRKKNPRHLQMN